MKGKMGAVSAVAGAVAPAAAPAEAAPVARRGWKSMKNGAKGLAKAKNWIKGKMGGKGAPSVPAAPDAAAPPADAPPARRSFDDFEESEDSDNHRSSYKASHRRPSHKDSHRSSHKRPSYKTSGHRHHAEHDDESVSLPLPLNPHHLIHCF